MELPANIDLSSHTRADISDSIRQNKVPAFKIIGGQLQKVKKLINEQLAASAETTAVKQLLEYVNTRSGKMIRPGLVLLAGNAVGEITDEHIRIAAVFEMIHNATLLHDDVIDDGKKRRGQPTINSLWGNESAVLLGDFLLSRVLNMCTKLQPEVAKEIATTVVRVCEGELRQVSQRQNWQLSETQYLDIITEKSASVFSSCCYLGGFLSNGTEAQLQSLRRFGLNSGIAFQITDDLLDIIGDEDKTGKTLGSDVVKNKLTLAVIHLLRVVDESEKSVIESKLSAAGKIKVAFAEMLRSYGSLEYARRRAQEFVEKAISSLNGLEQSRAKAALVEMAKFVGDRVA